MYGQTTGPFPTDLGTHLPIADLPSANDGEPSGLDAVEQQGALLVFGQPVQLVIGEEPAEIGSGFDPRLSRRLGLVNDPQEQGQ